MKISFRVARFIFLGLLLAASLCLLLRETAVERARLHVLMYHHLVPEGEDCGDWAVTGARFRADLQWLADNGWTTVLPGELAAGAPLPDKAVMITFDDGYRSNYDIAYPLLREFQAKAAVSVVARYVDAGLPNFLSWDMCREMAQSGLVEIGSHTYDCHGDGGIQRRPGEDLETYQARIRPDIQASIDLIERNVGTRPLLFAYPYGGKDRWATGFIESSFPVTLVTIEGRSSLKHGLHDLQRYNVSMDTPLCDILS